MKSCPFCGAGGKLKDKEWVYADHYKGCFIKKGEPVHIDIWENRDIDDVIEWIIKNVTVDVVPGDEGNEEALIYNLVHLAVYGKNFRRYDYEDDQDREIESLYIKYERKE